MQRAVFMKQVAFAVLSLSMLADATPALAQAKKTIRISIVLPATGTQFGDRLRFGAEAAAATFGGAVKLKVTGPAQIDPSQEVSIFQNEALSKPDAIIVGPIPASLFVEPALQAQKDGIKVTWIVVPPTRDIKDGLFVGNNEYEMGKTAGALLADKIIAAKGPNPSGTVVPGICIPGLTNLEDRLAGAKEALNQRLPGVRIANTIDTGNERGRNYAAWDQAIQANPDGLAFYDACEPGMINLTKLKEDDKRGFALVVWDTPDEVLAGVKQGVVSSAVPPSHFISGYTSVYLVANALLNDRPIPNGWVRTPTQVINSSNIDAFSQAETSAAGMLTYFKPEIDKLIAGIPAQLPPLAASHR
ncbi:monosaccharide ABC transporter substrate-binding protein (CUT2 family) [Bosea sp. AK1]|uniref:sugar ABC transporter substrate-binding protein n=1 Tax=Bosea sp. AK1 TaxID=2587160 RepID=UPI00114EF668|nr:sugar ABC transporter substrate-binding protein [Bosea sp. AK1]TQI65330.1 monosaccharide ABC transporter substrate-binding protein (CUT2 family) [Bosea sp. AK1]